MGILNEKIKYEDLNSKQQEIYNFQKVSAIFAEYGYSVTLLRDDIKFADFVAVPFLREEKTEPLWVQLKGGLTFQKKYEGKGLLICFFDKKNKTWYLYPHDDLYSIWKQRKKDMGKDDYKVWGEKAVPAWAKTLLEEYKID